MSTLMSAMTLVLCIAMIGAALLAIRERTEAGENCDTHCHTKELPVAILAAGLVSLIAAILFLILAAPDVAMTEAAIGSGLTTFLFFFVLGRIRGGGDSTGDSTGSDKHG
jgi:NADH:ubiquinone oxidoreductase subunit 6 (subunit J)